MTSTSYHSGERTKRSSPSKQNLCFEQQHARDTIGRSSSNFPPWLWSLLVKVAGMKLDNGNYATSTHCSLILYIITCLTSIVFSTTQTWYTIDGVLKSQRTPLQGVLRMVVTILWCWVGIYSPKLVYRLLSHPVIRDGVRWPSQAVFRLNVAGLVALLCVILVVVSNYSARTLLHLNWDTSGNTIQLKNSLAIMVALEVTYASQLLFSIVILFWNLTVVFILLSTCRTYTIGTYITSF